MFGGQIDKMSMDGLEAPDYHVTFTTEVDECRMPEQPGSGLGRRKMATKIFTNLPARDLRDSVEFFSKNR